MTGRTGRRGRFRRGGPPPAALADGPVGDRPTSSYDAGLQHERTALAWERTAISAMVAGIVFAGLFAAITDGTSMTQKNCSAATVAATGLQRGYLQQELRVVRRPRQALVQGPARGLLPAQAPHLVQELLRRPGQEVFRIHLQASCHFRRRLRARFAALGRGIACPGQRLDRMAPDDLLVELPVSLVARDEFQADDFSPMIRKVRKVSNLD